MLCNLFETIVNQALPDYVIYVVGEKFYFFGKQEIAICINLQLPLVILKKSFPLDMHHHKTYMYINFQQNRVSRSVKTVHTNYLQNLQLAVRISKNHSFEWTCTTPSQTFGPMILRSIGLLDISKYRKKKLFPHTTDNILYTRRTPTADIVCQIDDHTATTIHVERNRNKLFSIVSTLLTCGQCDFAVRGKESKGGNLDKLLKFRIEAGDKILEDHIKNAPISAKYMSHRTQNEILNMCELVSRI